MDLKPILLVSPLALESEFSPSHDVETGIKCNDVGSIECGTPGEITDALS